LDFVKNSPDWFEEVPKWTDEDMLKFGEYMYKEIWGFASDGMQERVKKIFDDYLK